MSHQVANLGYPMRYDWNRPIRTQEYMNELARNSRKQQSGYYGRMVEKTMPKNVPQQSNLQGQMGNHPFVPYQKELRPDNDKPLSTTFNKNGVSPLFLHNYVNDKKYRSNVMTDKLFDSYLKKSLENASSETQMHDKNKFMNRRVDKYLK